MKVAIIDLGTNTFNILIADIKKGQKPDMLLKTKSSVMLGGEGLMTGFLSDKAFARSYAVLRDYHSVIKDFHCEQIYAFGTSAIRNAQNSEHFINKVERELNIKIVPISNQQESMYIFKAIQQAVPMDNENYLIIDIGGSNNELVIGNGDNILWNCSYDLGSARLLEIFKPSDPITQPEIAKLHAYFDDTMQNFNETIAKYPIKYIYGSSGAFDSFAEMIFQNKFKYPQPINAKNFSFTADDFDNIYTQLNTLPREQRIMIPGLETLRKDTIIASSNFVKYILNKTKVKQITQSSYAFIEGVAFSLSN